MILLLGGTHESIHVCGLLNELALPFILSVATPLGKNLYGNYTQNIHVGMLDEYGFINLIKKHNVTHIIDITHPHAQMVKNTALSVANCLEIPYHGFIRKMPKGTFDLCVENTQMAIEQLKGTKEKILVTGVKHAKEWSLAFDANQLLFRVMPSSASMSACESAGLTLDQIIAIKTPCSPKLTLALFEAYKIGWFVFKNSGNGGATQSNIDALNLTTTTKGLMISPKISLSQNQMYFETSQDLCSYIRAIFKKEV